MCDQFTKKECVYSHPPSPLSPMYRNEKSKFYTHRISTSERQQRMLDGLILHESLDALSTNGQSKASTGVVETAQRLSITNEKCLASYNKLADNKIAVPGFPQKFVPPAETLSVKLDADEHEDPKGCKSSRRAYPTYTHNLEPLVCAVECMTKRSNSVLETTDIVANAGSLYRLFHYYSRVAISAHRFDLEWRPKKDGSGGTLLMQQWNADPDHKISYGRGNNFASMTCHYPDEAPDFLKDSFTHHRVLSYGFGSLQCVIHCEADGFYEPVGMGCEFADISVRNSSCQTPPPTRRQSIGPSISQTGPKYRKSTHMPPTPPLTPPGFPSVLLGSPGSSRFACLSVEETEDDNADTGKSSIQKSDTLDITINLESCSPAPETYVEVKTFSMARKKGLAVPPEPQLYFGRTKQLYKAGHMYGNFRSSGSSSEEQVQDMTEALRQWEEKQQETLARVHSALVHIRKLASEMAGKGHTKLCLVCPGPDKWDSDPMSVYIRYDERSFLPANA